VNFFEAYETGQIEPSGTPAQPGEKSNQALVDLLKEGQRRSQHWKCAWASYCQHYGGGIHDPGKHKTSFLVGFLDFLGQNANIGPDGSLGMMMPPEVHLNKRQRTGGQGPAGPPQTGDPEKDALVVKVKTHQRKGEVQNKEWENFCDINHGGVRDPVRHEKEVLVHFLQMHGLV